MSIFFQAVILANRKILELIESSSNEYLSQSISLGVGGDISSKIDLLAEEIFIEHLSSFGNIHSEECGFIDNKKSDDIVIDPIDGSDNFASILPYYGTSVALKRDGKCIGAVIVNLANGEIFMKDSSSFKRASLTKMQFRDVQINTLSKLGIFERAYCSQKTTIMMQKHGIKYRSPGALALSLAYAHSVDFVLYEGKAREHDIAAGLYMCEDLCVEKRDDLLLVSKNKELFGKILQFI